MKVLYLNGHAWNALLLALFLSIRVSAQEEVQYPPPTAPFVAPLPENAHWTIKVKSNHPDTDSTAPAAGAALKAPIRNQLQSIDVTKTDSLKRDRCFYSNGTTVEVWYAKDLLLFPDSNGQPTIFNLGQLEAQSSNGASDPVRSAGYTGVGWIDIKNYDKVVTYEGRPAYHYRIVFSAPPTRRPQKAQRVRFQSSAEAWIDAKTRMPMGYTDSRGRNYTYIFSEAPSTPLELPSSYQSALAEYVATKER